jgi:hypothetical protein
VKSATICPNCGDDLITEAVWRRCLRCGGRWTTDGQPYVDPSWVACPVCADDWVREYREDGGHLVVWACAECESGWLSSEAVGPDSSDFLPNLVEDFWSRFSRVEKA